FMGIPIENARIRDIDRLQRFNQSGFLDGIVVHSDEVIPSAIDGDDVGAEFGIWQDPLYQKFDGTQASIKIRAKLLPALFNTGAPRADRIFIYAKDMDGDDTAPGQGLEQYRYDVLLNQFNTSTFTTVTIPMLNFTSRTLGFEGINDG